MIILDNTIFKKNEIRCICFILCNLDEKSNISALLIKKDCYLSIPTFIDLTCYNFLGAHHVFSQGYIFIFVFDLRVLPTRTIGRKYLLPHRTSQLSCNTVIIGARFLRGVHESRLDRCSC